MKGKLIVIDGVDGSGKATQAKLLMERLAKDGIAAEKIDFPRYGTPVFGELLGELLAGKRGDYVHLDPRIASTLFSLDRFEASEQIRQWLSEGKVVIADRFSTSNQIHQGGKIVDEGKREVFFAWVEHMEHDVLKVPRPDLVVHLRISVALSHTLLSKEREVKNAALAEGEKDVAEKDQMYLERSYESAEHLAKSAGWQTVECEEGGAVRTPEAIHEDVYRAVQEKLVY